MSTLPGTPDDRAASTPRYDDYTDETGEEWVDREGAGWLAFAAIMLGLGGAFGVFHGIYAIRRSSFFTPNAHYPFSDLRTWGWIALILGIVAILAALNVLKGSQWARWAGIFVAAVQAIAQLMMIQAYPLWSLCVFAIDILVIYALATRGGSFAER